MANDIVARTRIKVCGMTQLSQAKAAVEAGVDALGFIFASKSPRNIDPENARKIIATLPPFVDAVGVFVNEDQEVVEEIVNFCGLTVIQLHGSESVDYCEKFTYRIMKALSVGSDGLVGNNLDMNSYADVVSGFLFDTYHKDLAGGSGVAFDWNILDTVKPPGPLILAGGLSPENVRKAVQRVRPFAVDVNSGVEIEPGIKNIDKIRQVVSEVRQADIEHGG